MWPNYFRYEKVKLYTIVEVFRSLDPNASYYDSEGEDTYFSSNSDFNNFLLDIMSYQYSAGNNVRWNYSFLEYNSDADEWQTTPLATKVVSSVIDRYADEFFLASNKEDGSTEFVKECQKRVNKLINILDFTYPKYSALLSAYDTAKNELMAGVGWTESESIENSQEAESSGSSSNANLLKINDTPQIKEATPTLYDTDDYVSEYHKDNGEESHSEESSLGGTIEREKTISNDKETKIERLAELEKKYSLVWKNWLNEFDKLFTSEENY